MKSKRKGFTLVELLIVIVVIGILSSMMMLSSTEAVTSAKATDIIANLRNLKTAALAVYAVSFDEIDKDDSAIQDDDLKNAAFSYMSNGNGDTLPEKANYYIHKHSTNKTWFVICEIKGTADEIAQIQKKLKGRSKSLGLLEATSSTNVSTGEVYDGKNKFVAMQIR